MNQMAKTGADMFKEEVARMERLLKIVHLTRSIRASYVAQLIQQKDIEETYGLLFPSPVLQREYNEVYQAKKHTDPS